MEYVPGREGAAGCDAPFRELEAEDKQFPSRPLKTGGTPPYRFAYLRLLKRLQKTGLVGRSVLIDAPLSASGW